MTLALAALNALRGLHPAGGRSRAAVTERARAVYEALATALGTGRWLPGDAPAGTHGPWHECIAVSESASDRCDADGTGWLLIEYWDELGRRKSWAEGQHGFDVEAVAAEILGLMQTEPRELRTSDAVCRARTIELGTRYGHSPYCMCEWCYADSRSDRREERDDYLAWRLAFPDLAWDESDGIDVEETAP